MQTMEFEQIVDLTSTNKLLIEEGTPIARIIIRENNVILAAAVTDIIGTPEIRYNNGLYKGVSHYPEGLIDAIKMADIWTII